jgi:hypothetical protein
VLTTENGVTGVGSPGPHPYLVTPPATFERSLWKHVRMPEELVSLTFTSDSDIDTTAVLVSERLGVFLSPLNAPERGGAYYGTSDLDGDEQIVVKRNVHRPDTASEGSPGASVVRVLNTKRAAEIEGVFKGTPLRLAKIERSLHGGFGIDR